MCVFSKVSWSKMHLPTSLLLLISLKVFISFGSSLTNGVLPNSHNQTPCYKNGDGTKCTSFNSTHCEENIGKYLKLCIYSDTNQHSNNKNGIRNNEKNEESNNLSRETRQTNFEKQSQIFYSPRDVQSSDLQKNSPLNHSPLPLVTKPVANVQNVENLAYPTEPPHNNSVNLENTLQSDYEGSSSKSNIKGYKKVTYLIPEFEDVNVKRSENKNTDFQSKFPTNEASLPKLQPKISYDGPKPSANRKNIPTIVSKAVNQQKQHDNQPNVPTLLQKTLIQPLGSANIQNIPNLQTAVNQRSNQLNIRAFPQKESVLQLGQPIIPPKISSIHPKISFSQPEQLILPSYQEKESLILPVPAVEQKQPDIEPTKNSSYEDIFIKLCMPLKISASKDELNAFNIQILPSAIREGMEAEIIDPNSSSKDEINKNQPLKEPNTLYRGETYLANPILMKQNTILGPEKKFINVPKQYFHENSQDTIVPMEIDPQSQIKNVLYPKEMNCAPKANKQHYNARNFKQNLYPNYGIQIPDTFRPSQFKDQTYYNVLLDKKHGNVNKIILNRYQNNVKNNPLIKNMNRPNSLGNHMKNRNVPISEKDSNLLIPNFQMPIPNYYTQELYSRWPTPSEPTDLMLSVIDGEANDKKPNWYKVDHKCNQQIYANEKLYPVEIPVKNNIFDKIPTNSANSPISTQKNYETYPKYPTPMLYNDTIFDRVPDEKYKDVLVPEMQVYRNNQIADLSQFIPKVYTPTPHPNMQFKSVGTPSIFLTTNDYQNNLIPNVYKYPIYGADTLYPNQQLNPIQMQSTTKNIYDTPITKPQIKHPNWYQFDPNFHTQKPHPDGLTVPKPSSNVYIEKPAIKHGKVKNEGLPINNLNSYQPNPNDEVLTQDKTLLLNPVEHSLRAEHGEVYNTNPENTKIPRKTPQNNEIQDLSGHMNILPQSQENQINLQPNWYQFDPEYTHSPDLNGQVRNTIRPANDYNEKVDMTNLYNFASVDSHQPKDPKGYTKLSDTFYGTEIYPSEHFNKFQKLNGNNLYVPENGLPEWYGFNPSHSMPSTDPNRYIKTVGKLIENENYIKPNLYQIKPNYDLERLDTNVQFEPGQIQNTNMYGKPLSKYMKQNIISPPYNLPEWYRFDHNHNVVPTYQNGQNRFVRNPKNQIYPKYNMERLSPSLQPNPFINSDSNMNRKVTDEYDKQNMSYPKMYSPDQYEFYPAKSIELMNQIGHSNPVQNSGQTQFSELPYELPSESNIPEKDFRYKDVKYPGLSSSNFHQYDPNQQWGEKKKLQYMQPSFKQQNYPPQFLEKKVFKEKVEENDSPKLINSTNVNLNLKSNGTFMQPVVVATDQGFPFTTQRDHRQIMQNDRPRNNSMEANISIKNNYSTNSSNTSTSLSHSNQETNIKFNIPATHSQHGDFKPSEITQDTLVAAPQEKNTFNPVSNGSNISNDKQYEFGPIINFPQVEAEVRNISLIASNNNQDKTKSDSIRYNGPYLPEISEKLQPENQPVQKKKFPKPLLLGMANNNIVRNDDTIPLKKLSYYNVLLNEKPQVNMYANTPHLSNNIMYYNNPAFAETMQINPNIVYVPQSNANTMRHEYGNAKISHYINPNYQNSLKVNALNSKMHRLRQQPPKKHIENLPWWANNGNALNWRRPERYYMVRNEPISLNKLSNYNPAFAETMQIDRNIVYEPQSNANTLRYQYSNAEIPPSDNSTHRNFLKTKPLNTEMHRLGKPTFIKNIENLPWWAGKRNALIWRRPGHYNKRADSSVDTLEKRQIPQVKTYFNDKIFKHGLITYSFSPNADNSSKGLIREAVNKIQLTTCLVFREKPENEDVNFQITFVDGECCCATPKDTMRHQTVWMKRSCLHQPRGGLHALLHLLGLPHELTHQDRDEHLIIHPNLVKPEFEWELEKKLPKCASFYMPFDHKSVMNVPSHYGSVNNETTILHRQPNEHILEVEDLSPIDIAKLNILYEDDCNKRPPDFLNGCY